MKCSASDQVLRCTVPGPHRVIDVPDDGSFAFATSASILISLTRPALPITGSGPALIASVGLLLILIGAAAVTAARRAAESG